MLDQIVTAVNSALESDLPDVEGENWRIVDGRAANVGGPKRRPNQSEIEIIAFPQCWSSGALGFPGAAGMMMTTAQTVIVSFKDAAWVYFGGRFAYSIENWRGNKAFAGDVKIQRMASQIQSFSRYE